MARKNQVTMGIKLNNRLYKSHLFSGRKRNGPSRKRGSRRMDLKCEENARPVEKPKKKLLVRLGDL
ncbi:hypothetical protein ACFL35_01880 [Candidatus Riflebacteria bacterium]